MPATQGVPARQVTGSRVWSYPFSWSMSQAVSDQSSGRHARVVPPPRPPVSACHKLVSYFVIFFIKWKIDFNTFFASDNWEV